MLLPEWSDPARRDDALDRVAAAVFGPFPRRLRPSASELRVLECLSNGMTARMAAEALGISVETVKSHLRSARRRLAAKNSTHAVTLAIRLGMIP